jgi:hypothetical protein
MRTNLHGYRGRCVAPAHDAIAVAIRVAGLLALAGCTPHRTPPPSRSYADLPVSGTLADARKAGFTRCVSDPVSMRCRRSAVMVEKQGPYEAAVDLVGSDGNGGFDLLTLWNDQDEAAVMAIGDALGRSGWRSCITGHGDVGEQEIFTRAGVPFIFSMDVSYWMHRRMRLIPIPKSFRKPC